MGALDPQGGAVADERQFLTVRYVEQVEVDRIVVDEQALRRNRAFADRHALEVDAEAILPDGLVDLKRDRRDLDPEIVEQSGARLGRQLGKALRRYGRRKLAAHPDDDGGVRCRRPASRAGP